MGFRTNFLHYSTKYLNSIKNTPINEEGYFYFEFEESKEQRLIYDAFTNSVLDNSKNEDICSPIFDNCPDDCDNLYLRMNKKQFANFIKYVLKNFIEYKLSKQIRFNEFDKLKDELKNGYESESYYPHNNKNMRVIDKLISNQMDENMAIDWYCYDLKDIDEILDDKWCVSKSWETKLGICNLIHIYHMMDWNNEEIVIIGG